MNINILTFVVFVTFVVSLSLASAAPVSAQKDAMKIDEKLSVGVVKKTDAKDIKPAKALPDPVKPSETLEIETKRGVKQ